MHELTGRTHWHEPTGNNRAGFGEFGRPKTPYDLFMESEGIPIYRDIGVSKVQNLPLRHGNGWAAKARTSSCTAPRANGDAMWSRCRAQAR